MDLLLYLFSLGITLYLTDGNGIDGDSKGGKDGDDEDPTTTPTPSCVYPLMSCFLEDNF